VLVIQKYGGTSVEGPDRILAVADRIAARRRAGDDVVVVVSAMGQTTDELLRLADQVSPTPSRRELDMLLTAGERISMALLSMALHDRDTPAISFTGSQSGILTDTRHGEAEIVDVRPIRIGPELERGRVVIVAGFQGVSAEKEITTLGRGGSDTTAIALAHYLGAGACEIYTDVPGVMTADPRVVPEARVLPDLDFDTMSAMAHLGAGVMHHRAVDRAREWGRPFRVRPAHDDAPGTGIGEVDATAVPALVAVCGRLSGGSAEVAVVGRRAAETAARARGILEAAGIGAGEPIVDARSLRLPVPGDRLADAQRLLHGALVAEPAAR